jgi:4-hydroxybenzoate polyprenyltransferase
VAAGAAARDKLRLFGRLIKIEHTLFALPFSLGSLILASGGTPAAATTGWVVLALVAGRSFAMAANRVIDRHVDRANPRTAWRELPAGLLGLREVLAFMAVAGALLFVAVWHLPPLCMKLLPVALALVVGYSYTKFFTPLCHLVLGLALATPVVGARIAVTGRWEWQSIWLALAVMLWVAGFDIVYACQDVEFDRAARLHSIPAWLGPERSLAVSLAMHAFVVPSLAAFGLLARLAWPYHAGLALIAGILAWEHRLCRGTGPESRVQKAFFDANVLVSSTFLAGSIAAVAALP